MLFFQALAALFTYDILNVFCSFHTMHSMVRSWKVANTTARQGTIECVCHAVNHACAWYPKQALCLQRSFVTTYLLRIRGISAHMVLGAQKMPFQAHAWVEVEGRAVNERTDVQQTYLVWERL